MKLALLLVDIQEGLDELAFYGGNRNNLFAEANCAKLLKTFREKDWPIFHVKHNSTNPDSPLYPEKSGNQIKKIVHPLPGERVFEKNVNSAFIGTDLEKMLRIENINHLIIGGLTTEHCISTSVRMAANLGFKVTLPHDACAAFDKTGVEGDSIDANLVHQIEIASLKDEFAEIVVTESVLTDLLK